MSDDWQYRVLWEFAGLPVPDLHEDELQALSNSFSAASSAVWTALNAVSKELDALRPDISADAFDTLDQRWKTHGKVALRDLASTLADISIALGRALTTIYEWKANLVLVVGATDMGLTVFYVGTGGLGLLADKLAGNVLAHELQHLLEGKLAELEAHLIRLTIDNTPLKDLEHLVTKQLDALIKSALTTGGHAAGHYAGGH